MRACVRAGALGLLASPMGPIAFPGLSHLVWGLSTVGQWCPLDAGGLHLDVLPPDRQPNIRRQQVWIPLLAPRLVR